MYLLKKNIMEKAENFRLDHKILVDLFELQALLIVGGETM